MRIGLMIGSDKERARADRLTGLFADGQAAEDAGFTSFWVPQVPGYLDAMTAIALLGQVTERIEIGTAVVPIQTRHPVTMAQQALTTQLACSDRFALGLGPSHDWIVDGQLGLSYDRPVRLVRDYLQVLDAAFGGPGPVDVENDSYRVHSPFDVADPMPMPVLLAALGPTMLQIAGQHASGTILWMADERAIHDHVAPRINSAAMDAGRPTPRIVAGVPVTLCSNGDVDDARAYASEVLGPRPLLAELRPPAGTRRRGRCRRHHGRRGRASGAGPTASLPRRRGHGPRHSHRAAGSRRRRPHRVTNADPAIHLLALPGALTADSQGCSGWTPNVLTAIANKR